MSTAWRCPVPALTIAAILAITAGSPCVFSSSAQETGPASAALPHGGCVKSFHEKSLYWYYDDEHQSVRGNEPDDLPSPTNRIITGCFAWQTLLALSFPAQGGDAPVRGGAEGPMRWEEWETVDQVFPPDETPGPCSRRGDSDAVPGILSMTTGLSPEIKPHMKGSMGCLDHDVLDASRKTVWKEILLDATFAKAAREADFDNLSDFSFPAGSMVIKTTWKVFNRRKDDPEAFYQREIFLDKGKNCVKKRMALVALHLIRKTQTYPGWIWTTFEHNGNAPTRDGPELEQDRWTFYNPSSEAPWNEVCIDKRRRPCPNQIVRLAAIHDDSREVNTHWWNELPEDSVWRHYALVGTQWSRDGIDVAESDKEVLGNPSLANAVMEMACQDPIEHPRGCMGCHASSDAVDMSFVFQHVSDDTTASGDAP